MEDIWTPEFEYINEEELDKAISKDIRDIKRSIEIDSYDDFGLIVWAVAVSKNGKNEDLCIPCDEAVPISDVAYDTVRDLLCIRGVSYHQIGYIPYHFMAGVKGSIWRVEVPAPLVVLRRHMNESQKKEFDLWKACYPADDYETYFLQAMSTYGGDE